MAALAVAVALVGIGALVVLRPSGAVREAAASCERDCMPMFAGRTLEGGELTADSLRGKVVLVNFWATWCRPCLSEIPALQSVYQRHRHDGFEVVGVLIDRGDGADALGFLRSRGANYPSIVSTPAIERAFGDPQLLPTSFLYDKAGNLRGNWKGGIRERELEDEVAGLLSP